MTLNAQEAGRARLWQQWLRFEATHPGTALALSAFAVLVASAVVLATFALLPFPEAAPV